MSVILDSTTNPEKCYALAIIAHPDDESFLLAGTTLKFAEEGKMVKIVCATKGEKGEDRHQRPLSTDQMAEMRTLELQIACGILNCECKKLFDYPDGGLDQIDFDKLVNELIDQVNIIKPQVILTFGEEGITGHQDHIIIGKAAVAASKQAKPKPSEIWLVSMPSSNVEDFQYHYEKNKIHKSHFKKTRLKGVADDKLMKIDIRKYKNKKIAALCAHNSQYIPEMTWPGFFEEECFEIIKL